MVVLALFVICVLIAYVLMNKIVLFLSMLALTKDGSVTILVGAMTKKLDSYQ